MKTTNILNAVAIFEQRLVLIVKNHERWSLPGGFEKRLRGYSELLEKVEEKVPGVVLEAVRDYPVEVISRGEKGSRVKTTAHIFNLIAMPEEPSSISEAKGYALATGREIRYGFSNLMIDIFESLRDSGYLKAPLRVPA